MILLVTGHKGYIGSRLFKELRSRGDTVYGMDIIDGPDSDASNLDNLNRMFADKGIEVIFHLAAIPRVQYSIENPHHVMMNNFMSSQSVFEFARLNGVRRVVYSSSSSVVGNGAGPVNPYGLSKLIPEMIAKIYSLMYGLDSVSIRYFNVYSEDQKADDKYATVIAMWMKDILDKRSSFITGDGEQRRDMIHVSDVVSANIFCAEYAHKFSAKNINIGTGSNISLNEIKEILLSYNKSHKFHHVSPRENEVVSTLAEEETTLSSLGWKPKISIENGIRNCFKGVKE